MSGSRVLTKDNPYVVVSGGAVMPDVYAHTSCSSTAIRMGG